MTIRSTYAAESWDKVYTAFEQINFASYDYDTVKESLIQYLKIYHSEAFNDFIESSELIAVLELFAYIAELLAYRVDVMSHENFISTAQRKQSVLRLAKLISYRASRNIPARGLVKITSIRTSEQVIDSLGNNLSNITIFWNDSNNSNWKEQFMLVMNKVMTSKFGQPSKTFTVNDVLMQVYTFNNSSSFRNGVHAFKTSGDGDAIQMEVVPADLDENGPFERAPDLNSQFNILYASDGRGDGSDYTGFLMFVKQGSLLRTDYSILEKSSNRRIELDSSNINDTDIWVYRVDDASTIIENWERVETLNEQNLYFNNLVGTKRKYEVETLENDKVALIFGDGNFSEIPIGDFQLWTRVSLNTTLNIPRSKIVNVPMGFSYINKSNLQHDFSATFSLTTALQNNSPSESIEHIRQSAPATYYAQNRMVNGQDYNTFMLKDPTILKLKTINRTFAGQPKYVEWNDSSRRYENIKLFGDDLRLFLDVGVNSIESKVSSKGLIDSIIEPLLQTTGVSNTLTHIMASSEESYGIITQPRRKFIEDNRPIFKSVQGSNINPYGEISDGSLNEKSAIQSALDQHWYGEPLSFSTINGIRHAVIPDYVVNPKFSGKIYLSEIPRTIDGMNTYPPGDSGSGLQASVNFKYFGLRFHKFLKCIGNGSIQLTNPYLSSTASPTKREVFTIEMMSDGSTFTVISNLRGRLPDYSLTLAGSWQQQNQDSVPFNFTILQGTVEFEEGDAFIIDFIPSISPENTELVVRTFAGTNSVNLNGWWQVMPESDIKYIAPDPVSGAGGNPDGFFAGGAADGPTLVQQLTLDPDSNLNSWVFLIARNDSSTGDVDSWSIYSRDLKIVAESPTTKFWFNQETQIIDPETKKPVLDKIRILRSNLDERGQPLNKADVYDAVSLVYDGDGNVDYSKIELLPAKASMVYGDPSFENILQFENFSKDSYEYGILNQAEDGSTYVEWLKCGDYQISSGFDLGRYDYMDYDASQFIYQGVGYFFSTGSFVGKVSSAGNESRIILRRRIVPAPVSPNIANNDSTGCNLTTGLDFMWQHFSPVTNLIDPSVTNIHDSFILTRGYYTSVMDFIRGVTDIMPNEPTPFELRTSYGYLLKNKMLSDTVVLHSGKIKLLFGQRADQRLRAKFRVIKSTGATFSDERIKQEIINVIDVFFDVQNWDFGDKFYATELISLIHQRLANQISSVVIVPMYSVNSFGALFTIDSGFDEILQSSATVDDVEIVDALTPATLRQFR